MTLQWIKSLLARLLYMLVDKNIEPMIAALIREELAKTQQINPDALAAKVTQGVETWLLRKSGDASQQNQPVGESEAPKK